MKSQRVHVFVNLYDKTYDGELYLGKRDEVYVDLKDCFASRGDLPLIKCEADGKTFFLHDNDLLFGRIYSKYIVDSYSQSGFSSFEFYLDGTTEWFQSLDDENVELFREIVKIGGIKYNCAAALNKKGFLITVESINNQIELDSIEFITLQFSRLFSFLCYNKVTCCGASILDNKKNYPVYSFLFNDSECKQDCRYSLLSARCIHMEDLWSTILHNYFEQKTKYFDVCLNNFYGQIKFEGYWGYEFFGLFAILDKYTNVTNVGKTTKIFSAESIDSVVRRVKNFIASQKSLSDEEKQIFSLLPGKIQNMNVWNEGNSAKSRLHYLLSKDGFFNADERNLFALIEVNLKRLLDLRIKIAHGECLDSQGGRIYNNFLPLIYQLKILTIWIIYRELGVPSKIIWLGTRDSRHNDVRNAKIDATRLSVMVGDIPVFKVSKKTFDYLSEMQINPCLVFDSQNESLIHDELLTKKAEEILYKERLRSIVNSVSRVEPQYNNPVYLNRILIKCENEYKTIWGVVIANYECVPAELQEKCEKKYYKMAVK